MATIVACLVVLSGVPFTSWCKKQVYKTGEVAQILGVTVKTVQNYDRDGKLMYSRSQGNRRNILREDLLRFLEELWQSLLEA